MDTIALEGYGVFISGIIVFCGSIWLLLAVVLGSRLAYFITATVTLGFLLIMSTVWSFTQLGPLGELPSWSGISAAADPAEVDFPAAGAYPEGEWAPPAEDDDEAITHATEAEGAAGEYLSEQIDTDKITTFGEDAEGVKVEPVATTDSTLLLQDGENLYGATLFQAPAATEGGTVEPASVGDPETVLVVVEFHPGNPLGVARKILVGVLLLFVLHLVGLSRAERKAKGTEVTA